MNYTLSDFDYVLPAELIAALPPKDRPSARLLACGRETGKFSHHIFRDLPQFLKPGDLLVLNNTKVIPARLFGRRQSGGQVEILLLENVQGNQWEVLLRPGGRVKKFAEISFDDNGKDAGLEAVVLDDGRLDSGERRVEFFGKNVPESLNKIGHMPLPPYIDRPDAEIDREMYQTVFAEKEGAVASPTAGLHFDQALLEELRQKGVEIAFVTLHVSYGTFQPVTAENLTDHKMFFENYEINAEAADKINKAAAENRRVIACGTTSVRTLESAADDQGKVHPKRGKTNLFIYPPYSFKVVRGLITNFHLPKSTLLCLVAALAGHENLKKYYAEAIREKYRFYSYGDAMLIL